jgi:hypothetical protein
VKSEKRKVKNSPLSILAVIFDKNSQNTEGAISYSTKRRKVINEQTAHLSLFVFHLM